ncbi:MAG: hypothetical protein EOP40_04065 [Rubrivivax sp.]|nr:MAG: hypothetical protein EOP40_04065 [Rubrivivax sp.]
MTTRHKLTASLLAVVLGVSSLGTAQARDGRDDHDRDRRGDRHEQRHDHRHDDRHDHRRDDRRSVNINVGVRPVVDHRYDHRHDARHDHRRGWGYDRHFARGQRLPVAYRGHGYVVNDWRGRHLQAPPRGHQWVQVGRDQMLVAIATGVIAQLILSQ